MKFIFGRISSDWLNGWGILLLVSVLALPLLTPRVYASDEIKYFSILRSVFFDRDLHFENEYQHFIEQDPVAHAGLVPFRDTVTPTGYRLNDAPIGTAVLWSPFYFAADLSVALVRLFGVPIERNGYSWPYVWSVCVASWFWGTLGLFLIFQWCRSYAGLFASTLGVLAIWFASPIVFYLYITPAMSHANSLFAAALFLYVWHRWRRDRSVFGWMGLGLVAGLVILVRELNWLFLIVLVIDEGLSFLKKFSSDRERIRFNKKWTDHFIGECRLRASGYFAFLAVLSLVVIPQFYVYFTLNGTFGPTPFVVSKFSLVPVHFFDVLFSGFHGLFSWHPITLLGFFGLGVLWKRAHTVSFILCAVFVAQVVVVGSYDTWAGGASFGARRFVNLSPIFALGLAVLFSSVAVHARKFLISGVILLAMWNAGLAIQYSTGLIPRDAPVTMSQIAYNQVFEVPNRMGTTLWQFMFNRASFYETRQ